MAKIETKAELEKRVARLESELAAKDKSVSGEPARHPWRSFFSAILVFVAALLFTLSITAFWVRQNLLDTNTWVDKTTQIIQSPSVQSDIANKTVSSIFAQVNVSKYVADLLPDKAKPLAEPIAGALQTAAIDQVTKVLGSDQFIQFWKNANRSAHSALVSTLQNANSKNSDSSQIIFISSDKIILNVGPVLQNAKEALSKAGLGFVNNLSLSGVNAQITLATVEALPQVLLAVSLINSLAFWLPIITLLTFVGAILLARDKRRALMHTLVIAIILLILDIILIGVGSAVFVSNISRATNAISAQSAQVIYSTISADLLSYNQTALIVCILAAIFVYLSGSSTAGLWVKTQIADLLKGEAKTPVVKWLAANAYPIVFALVAIDTAVIVLSRLQNLPLLVILTLIVGIACVVLVSLPSRAKKAKRG